jgi:hypothetical protein
MATTAPATPYQIPPESLDAPDPAAPGYLGTHSPSPIYGVEPEAEEVAQPPTSEGREPSDEPHPIYKVPHLVSRLYTIVAEFETLFPGRKFTPDGHLVGSIGEVIAAHRYGLKLYPASTLAHDAAAPDGRNVEIKATQGLSVAMRAEPEHLIVLHLNKEGHATEVFNGPGVLAWERSGAMQRNGQRAISLFQLKKLMQEVPQVQRLPARDEA